MYKPTKEVMYQDLKLSLAFEGCWKLFPFMNKSASFGNRVGFSLLLILLAFNYRVLDPLNLILEKF